MKRVRVIPAPGLLIRDPATHWIIPPEGAEVVLTTFWRRRASEGDVRIVYLEP